MFGLRPTARVASALLGALLLAGGAGVLADSPAGAEGQDFTATCQSDGTYLVVLNYQTFVAASTIVDGIASLSGAYTGSLSMSPTFLANVDDVATGSTSIPGSTTGSLQMAIQLTSPNGGSGSGVTVELAGDCVAVAPDAPTNVPGDSAVGSEATDAVAAAAVVADPRTAG